MGILRSRKGAAGVATMLMLGAFLAVGGFLYWLNIQAAATQVVIEEDDANTPTAAMGMAFSEFASDPSVHMDAEVSVQGVEVASLMGEHQFWTQLNPNTPFLIRLVPEVVTGGLTFAYGDVLTLKGRVLQMSDSVLDAWVANGTLTDDQRFEAEFAETFLEASEASH